MREASTYGLSQESGEIAQDNMKRQKQEAWFLQRLRVVRLVQPSHTLRPKVVPCYHQRSGSSWGSAFLRRKNVVRLQHPKFRWRGFVGLREGIEEADA